MYEDLKQIANLRFTQDRESISEETTKRRQKLQQEYARMLSTSHIVASGPHLAEIGRSQIQGSIDLVKHLADIWIDLIAKRKGRIHSSDIPFIAKELEDLARIQKGHLHRSFADLKMRGITNTLTQEAERDLYAAIARVRRDLLIAVHEADAFPVESDTPKEQNVTAVHVHIQNSTVGNLNLGSQVGAINNALETISTSGPAKEFSQALKELTEATVSQNSLGDSEKKEIVEALSTMAEEAAKDPDKRSNGTLKAILMWLPSAISAAADLTTLWDRCGPAVKAFFGM